MRCSSTFFNGKKPFSVPLEYKKKKTAFLSRNTRASLNQLLTHPCSLLVECAFSRADQGTTEKRERERERDDYRKKKKKKLSTANISDVTLTKILKKGTRIEI